MSVDRFIIKYLSFVLWTVGLLFARMNIRNRSVVTRVFRMKRDKQMSWGEPVYGDDPRWNT